MPFYEYECQSCKFYSEVMQKISDAPLTKCPSCGKKTLKKLVSAPNFRLKGGGWYETDFKGDKENRRNLAGADKEESKADSGGSGKSETKADAKADSTTEAAKPAADAKPAKTEAKEPKESKSSGSSRSKSTPARPAKALVRAKPKAAVRGKAPARKKGRR